MTTSPPNLLINPGAETGSLPPWMRNSDGNAFVDNGTRFTSLTPHSGSEHFCGGFAQQNTLTQNVNIFNGTQGYTAAQLDSGTLSAYVVFYELSLDQKIDDKGKVSLIFRSSTGAQISNENTPFV